MPEANIVDRREEARRAMEGEEWQKRRTTEAAVSDKRREEARLAMEGSDRRAKRLAVETAKRATAEAAENATRAVAEKEAAARGAAQSALEAERARAAAAAAETAARQERATAATATINQLKSTPVTMNPVRTLRSDLAAAASGGGSLSQTVIENASKPSFIPAAAPAKRGGWLGWLVLLLLLLGMGIVAYLYFYTQFFAFLFTPTTPPPAQTTTNPTIPATPAAPLDEATADFKLLSDVEVPVTLEAGALALRQALNDGPIVPTQSARILLTSGGSPIALAPWLNSLKVIWPDSLKQTLEPKFLLGRYDDPSGPSTFLALRAKDYQRALTGLAAWEKDLPALFYQLTGHVALSPASGTSTAVWSSGLKNNLATRTLTRDGRAVLLHTIFNQKLIIIAEGNEALAEIINRLAGGTN